MGLNLEADEQKGGHSPEHRWRQTYGWARALQEELRGTRFGPRRVNETPIGSVC